MPVDHQGVQATPAQPAQDADAKRIAVAAVAKWRGIDAALSPIIGQRAVAALYNRSLSLLRADYPWLAAAHEDTLQPAEFSGLQTVLSQQASANAAAAHGALLQTFRDLLTSLIGSSLTERLLRSVLDNTSSGQAAQDSAP